MNSSFEDKEYWNDYYRTLIKSNKISIPSPFAKFLVESELINKSNLIELGCGNGRDAIFFSKNNALVTAIDQCNVTTKLLNSYEGINSYSSDFTSLPNVDNDNKYDCVYSRFTMHSIDEKGEDRTLQWAFDNLKPGGLFCIEVRTIKDTLYGKGKDKGNNIWYYNNHHRRFVNSETFKLKFEKIGFKMQFFQESNGFAKYKDEDPIVLRLIAIKP